MDKSKEKIIKKYMDSLSKEKRKDLKNCFKNNKNIDFYYFLLKYSKYHPLDFFTFTKVYLFKETGYSKDGKFLLSLLNERIITTKWNHFLKIYIWYIFEWQTLFSDETKRLKENVSSWNNLQSFRDLFDNFICNWLLENFNLKTFSKKITCDNYYKDVFYNDVYIAYYHQESTQFPLFSRISFIYDLLWKDYIKELEKLKKFLLIFIWIIYYANKKNVFYIKLDELLTNYLPKTIVSKQDILDFLDFIWVDDYKKYVEKVKTKNYSDYFLWKTNYDFINIELEIHKTPFINISKEIWEYDFYIFDESFLLKKFYSKLWDFSYDKIGRKKMSFWDIIEIYLFTFVKSWLTYKDSKLNDSKYISKQWVKFKDWEIDLLIYNKETKNLIIFESKDYKILNENLFKVEDIENLCKKEVKRETNWKIKTEPWSIYKWINQLLKHSKRKKEDIAKAIWEDNIKDIKYLFLTHNNSIFRNEIMRYFIDKNKEFKWLDYQFMNLTEFEMLISLWCKNWLDFYNLIKEKSEKIENWDRFKVILESFWAYNENWDWFGTSNAKWINQNFSIFFDKVYQYNWDNIAPFVSYDFFKELFKH